MKKRVHAALVESLDESTERDLLAAARAAAAEAGRLRVALRGAALGPAQQETFLPLDDLTLRLYMTTESWSGAPSPEQQRLTKTAHRDLEAVLAELAPLLGETLPALRRDASAAGVAWPGEELPAPLPGDLIPAFR